jgi:hypothetical protein
VTEDRLVHALTSLPGVTAVTASQANGAPEVSWGDSFFCYDPDDNPASRQFPFATIVTKDYPGFDTASNLNRPGVYRLNLAVGRERFKQLFGFPPAEFATYQDTFDYRVLDQVIPHPVYAKQAWVAILVPGARTRDQVAALITHAHKRARDRYKPR